MRVYCDESPLRIRHGRSEYLRVKEHQNPVRRDFFPKSADSCPFHRLFPLPLTASPSSLLPTTGLTLPPPRGSQPQALFGIQQGSASNWKPFQFPQTKLFSSSSLPGSSLLSSDCSICLQGVGEDRASL